MKRSEVFDAFVQIAQEKGLISEGEHAEHTEKTEDSPRWDSHDLSAIEALYGVKPNASKEMDYEHNIMEVAHPNSMVIAPSYDKLNGLVENEMERQNINMHIVFKNNDGLLTQRKYAETNLLMSLVRVANDMDNKDQDDLRLLADTCLGQLHGKKKIHKEAFLPLLLVAAGLIGVLYAQQHLADFDQGLQENYRNLQSQIADVLSDTSGWFVGHQYDASVKQDLAGLATRLASFMDLYSKTVPVIRNLEKPRNAQELEQLSKHPDTPEVMQSYETLRAAIQQIDPYLEQIQKNLSSDFYKGEHTEDKGTLTKLYEKIPSAFRPTADPMEDVVNALIPFRKSVKDMLDLLKNAKSIEQKAHSDFAAASAKSSQDLGENPFQNVPYHPPTSGGETGTAPAGIQDIDQQAQDLEKELSGMPGIGI